MPRISEEKKRHPGIACCQIQIGIIQTENPGKQHLFMCALCQELYINGQKIELEGYTNRLKMNDRHGWVNIQNPQAQKILGTSGFEF